MVTLSELKEKIGLTPLTAFDPEREAEDGYVCDLLSWVMARGKENMVWITVQTHINVLAVACLHDFACVIVPESIAVPKETIEKAEEEGVALFSSDKTAYKIAAIMAELGIGM